MSDRLELTIPRSLERPAAEHELLEAARRLDWRFLLPDPRLGSVVCLGAPNDTLLAALRLFSRQVAVVDPGGGREGTADLVVVSGASSQLLEEAGRLARPGAHVYVEARGLTARFLFRPAAANGTPAPGRSHPAALRNLALEAGLTEVALYWHWPDFDRCSLILPLGDPVSMKAALARLSAGRRGQIKAALGTWLLDLRLLARLVPTFSLVARRPANGIRE